MKTQLNLKNYLTKSLILAVIAISLMIRTSAQKNQDSTNSENSTVSQASLIVSNVDHNKNLASKAASKNAETEVSTEDFLIKAAGIKAGYTNESLENSPVSQISEDNSLETFLLNAAGLIQMNNCCETVNEPTTVDELENFLIHAANLNSVQDENANQSCSDIQNEDLDLTNFLVRAAGLNMSNNLNIE